MFHFLKIALFQVFASLGHWNTAVMVILALHLGPIWLVCFIIIIIIIGIITIVVIIIILIIQGVRFLPHKIKRALSSTSTPHLSMVIIIIIIIITVIL